MAEQMIKRSRAAALLDRTARTLRNYEIEGILTPIKLNCRSTVYKESEVEALLNGKATCRTFAKVRTLPS